jgi:hypothetical protein
MIYTNWIAAPAPPYYRDLLALSQALITEGRPELAVIVAQMACEVLSEQVLLQRLRRSDVPPMFNVHNKRVLALYKKVTKDPIDKAAFWKGYGTHAIRRHEVVHRSRRVSLDEARESLAAATAFVNHVEAVRSGLTS